MEAGRVLARLQVLQAQVCPGEGGVSVLFRFGCSSPKKNLHSQDTIKRTKILPTEVRRFRDNVSLMEAATAPDHHHQQQQSSSSSNGDDPLAEVVAALRLSEGAGAGGEAASTPDEEETAAVRGQTKVCMALEVRILLQFHSIWTFSAMASRTGLATATVGAVAAEAAEKFPSRPPAPTGRRLPGIRRCSLPSRRSRRRPKS